MAAGGLEVGPWCAHDPAYRPSRERSLRSRANAWWARPDSNQQPDRYERPALTIELRARARGLRSPFPTISKCGRQSTWLTASRLSNREVASQQAYRSSALSPGG